MARILAQRRQSRGVNQDQAVLAKLGLSYLQNAADEIDIGVIQTKRFARLEAGARGQADQRRQCAPSLRNRGGELAACRNEGGKFLIAQDTRRWNGAGPGKGTTIKRFGSRVVDHVITRNFLGEMMRKLSVTELQNPAQFRGTFSRRKPRVALANSAQVAWHVLWVRC